MKIHLLLLALLSLAACTTDDAPMSPGSDVTCESYCDTVIGSCGTVTGTDGGNAQYLSREGCLAQCSTMKVGKAEDRNVDTVGCRLHYATLAGQDAKQCRAAGSNGGGVCGANRCEVFCQQAVARCTPAYISPVPYASYGDCLSTCNAEFTFDATKSEVVFQGPDLNCRIAHLVAANDPSTGFGPPPNHCWHVDRVGTGGFCTGSASHGGH